MTEENFNPCGSNGRFSIKIRGRFQVKEQSINHKHKVILIDFCYISHQMRSLIQDDYPPSLAVLHVGVGPCLEQNLCDVGHATHHLPRVLLGAKGTHQVQGGLYRPNRGRVHLGQVADQEGGGKLITCGGGGREGARGIMICLSILHTFPFHDWLCAGAVVVCTSGDVWRIRTHNGVYLYP